MKRQRSSSRGGSSKKPRLQRQDATVQSVVRKELRKQTDWRFADDNQTALAVYNTSSIRSVFTNLSRGDAGLNNFQGNDIRPQAILLKYYCDTAQAFNTIRVMVIQWFDATTPVLSGILQNINTGTALVSPTLVTNKKYIKVLYDKTHMLAPMAGDNTGIYGNGIIDPVTVYIPGKRLRPVRYNSTTNVVQDGNIYVIAVSDDTALGTVNLTYYSRVTFADS